MNGEELSELMLKAATALRLCSNKAETDEWRDDLRGIQKELEAAAEALDSLAPWEVE